MTSIFQQISDALGIMVLGMGLVFVFLSILIVGVKLVAKWGAPVVCAKPSTAAAPQQVPNHGNNMEPQLLAAITAAIHQYRNRAQA
ncbi:OadG family protein [Shewanella gelidii]|uniref:Probable oxaloacetate decarboxylase gamma chain n=1 Tax=Shewanella gelidii TaxID=1642821 RepID=A0A917JH91_9GAMM|nr:OadG family transporter subunit [Shewanella gelidii]MCL1096577.1 OadG family protein [Shewanella gelidii]GGI68547.1 hypothetical protein GCM10009332_02110 [Shewanella gelidii]